MRICAFLALASLAFPELAAADAPRAEKMPVAPVLAFGDRNPACREWSDGCVVCVKTAAGKSCSTPGIACQPGEIRCKQLGK
jgi:hypothetical protein